MEYTERVLRRARIVLSSLILSSVVLGAVLPIALARADAVSPPPAARQPDPAQRLGQAWRAFEEQSFDTAYALAAGIDRSRLIHDDYALYVMAQSAFFLGRHAEALGHFRALAGQSGSRFRDVARWRVADCLWRMDRLREASAAYRRLVRQAGDQRQPGGDVGLARYRLAEILARQGRTRPAVAALRAFLREHPSHPLAEQAGRRLRQLGGDDAARLTAQDRLARAQTLTAERRWHRSYAELAVIGDDVSESVRRERDFWTGMTLFKMRRRYEDAGRILLRIYKDLGSRAAMAMFHGARALSRADRDREAIDWYQRVAAEFPRTSWAAEAQFLAGWLAFNLADYEAAIPLLERALARYGHTRWRDPARWFLGFSHFLGGQHARALPYFEALTGDRDRLIGGKARYWRARALQELERTAEAVDGYRALVAAYPFSWYALLAQSRLRALGIDIDPFGGAPREPGRVPVIDPIPDVKLDRDPLMRAADELLAAGLPVEAGVELRRGERGFLSRHPKATAMAVLMERYRRAGNYNRPWMLAVVHGGRRALDAAPEGHARTWWEHAYPLAYRPLIEQWRDLGNSPPYYLYAIMRKESGFDPHIVSYADARGLLQMIPPTTRRVVRALGLDYTEDMLYDPELNVRVGSWYIGRLYHKFKGQVPIAAGSYNSGPRPVMRWLRKNGHRPIDELVELVSYKQTRGYMKKVTETYARYLYLYEGEVYEQPLEVDADYVQDELTY